MQSTFFFPGMFLELLEALLDEEGEVDQRAIGRPVYLEVPEEDVGSEVVKCFLHNVFLPCSLPPKRF